MSVFIKKGSWKEILLIVFISVILTAIFIGLVMPALSDFLETTPTTYLIALLAVLVSIIGITWQIIIFRLKYVPKLGLDLSVKISGNLAVITSKLMNIGGKTIIPNNAYLFVDEGVLKNDSYYAFPFLLKHEGGKFDCILSELCKKERKGYPEDLLEKEFKNIYNECIPLKHLSSSILYVAPEENFSEDTTIKLPHPGVYRVIFIVTAEDADCICTSKQFNIEENNMKITKGN